MNIDFKLMARLAREEETALEKATLELQPATLGKNGGCHVVAQILKEMFPQYRIVSTTAKGDGMPPHVGCAIGKNFIDIEGIHPLPGDALDCEPVAESNPIYRGYLMKPRFLAEARTRLEPYVRSRIALYEVKEEGAANQAAALAARLERSVKMKSLAIHRYPAALIAIVVSLAMGSCSRKSEELSGSAVVLDEVLNAAQNNPLNLNDKIYRLVDIDGRSIERERPSPWEDARPGALVDPGDHLFKVSVAPVVRPAGYVPEVTTFAATVQANRLYVISSENGRPILIEGKRQPNKTSQSTTKTVTPSAGQEARQP